MITLLIHYFGTCALVHTSPPLHQAAMVVWSRWRGDFYSLFLLRPLERRSIISFSYMKLNGVRRAASSAIRTPAAEWRKKKIAYTNLFVSDRKEAQVSLKPIVLMHMRADCAECTVFPLSVLVVRLLCTGIIHSSCFSLYTYVDICVGSMRCCCNPWMHFPNG